MGFATGALADRPDGSHARGVADHLGGDPVDTEKGHHGAAVGAGHPAAVGAAGGVADGEGPGAGPAAPDEPGGGRGDGDVEVRGGHALQEGGPAPGPRPWLQVVALRLCGTRRLVEHLRDLGAKLTSGEQGEVQAGTTCLPATRRRGGRQRVASHVHHKPFDEGGGKLGVRSDRFERGGDLEVRLVRPGELSRFEGLLDEHHFLGHRLYGRALRFRGRNAGCHSPYEHARGPRKSCGSLHSPHTADT